MKRYKYTEQQFREAIASSNSTREALAKLGIGPAGGNYSTFRNRVKALNIDISHFTGKAWNKGQNFGPKRPIDDYLSNKFEICSDKLRRRLIREKFFEHICSGCNNITWCDKPIPLELDHIDGNNKNNGLKNLRLLCPNCHAQTDTYCGKNKGNYK